MTPSEYQQLTEFFVEQMTKQRAYMDERFDRMDERFEGVETRLGAVEERTTRTLVLGEDTRSRLSLVVERIDVLDAKVDRLADEMHEEFAAVRQELRDGLGFWGRRVEAIEERLDRERPR